MAADVLRRINRALAVGLLLLTAASVLGALITRGGRSDAPSEGVPIFVRSNGVHTDIVMPARVMGLDWHRLAPPGHVRDPASAGPWVAIGTGERDTFLNTPRWRDIRPETVAGAIFGGEVLLRVEHVQVPRPGPRVRALRLRPAQYRRLAAAIAGTFRRDRAGRAMLLHDTGYSRRDTFYLAHGRYDALRGCNQWTGDMLARAGVRVGRWTPLASSLLASLR